MPASWPRTFGIAATVVAGTASAIFLVRAFSPPPKQPSPIADPIDLPTLERLQARTPFVPLSANFEADVRTARETIAEAMNRAHVPDGPDIPEDVRASLADTLARHVAARASGNPSDYIRLVHEEGARWIPPSDIKAWAIISTSTEHDLGRQADPQRPEEELRATLEAQFVKDDLSLALLGSGERGLLIRFARVRSPGAIEPALWPGDAAAEYWHQGPTTAPRRFREPALTLEQTFDRDREVLIARVWMLVRTVRGSMTVIMSTWHFDPSSRRWMCHQIYNRGRGRYGVVF